MEYVFENKEEAFLKGKRLKEDIIQRYDVRSVVKKLEELYFNLRNVKRA